MNKLVKLALRLSIAIGFLSAVADRFGLWPANSSAWGNWDSFVSYTGVLNPWITTSMVPIVAIIATSLEILFSVFLIVGFKTSLIAKLSGILLLVFAVAMTFTLGIKAPLDYSVFSASAAAFALSLIKEPYLEVDAIITNEKL